MPQKRNPFLSQDIIAAAARIRALVPLAMEAMQVEHEAEVLDRSSLSDRFPDLTGPGVFLGPIGAGEEDG